MLQWIQKTTLAVLAGKSPSLISFLSSDQNIGGLNASLLLNLVQHDVLCTVWKTLHVLKCLHALQSTRLTECHVPLCYECYSSLILLRFGVRQMQRHNFVFA